VSGDKRQAERERAVPHHASKRSCFSVARWVAPPPRLADAAARYSFTADPLLAAVQTNHRFGFSEDRGGKREGE